MRYTYQVKISIRGTKFPNLAVEGPFNKELDAAALMTNLDAALSHKMLRSEFSIFVVRYTDANPATAVIVYGHMLNM